MRRTIPSATITIRPESTIDGNPTHPHKTTNNHKTQKSLRSHGALFGDEQKPYWVLLLWLCSCMESHKNHWPWLYPQSLRPFSRIIATAAAAACGAGFCILWWILYAPCHKVGCLVVSPQSCLWRTQRSEFKSRLIDPVDMPGICTTITWNTYQSSIPPRKSLHLCCENVADRVLFVAAAAVVVVCGL